MDLFIINTHSFADLVTNSSSEVWICDIRKSVDMVKDLLQKLIQNHNEILGQGIYKFEDCFGNIEVSKYDFSLSEMPELYKKWCSYEKYREYREYYDSDLDRPASFTLADKKQKSLEKVHPYYTTKWSDYDKTGDEEKKKRETLFRDYVNQQNIIWTQYGAEKLKIENEIFLEFLRVNNFSDADIQKATVLAAESVADHLKNNKGEYTHILGGKLSKNLVDAYDRFLEFFSWKMKIKKGQILVYSREDNSVPYELFELIGNYLNAQRYHLG